MKKDKHISIRVNRRLHKKMKEKAKREGMSFSVAVRFALKKWAE